MNFYSDETYGEHVAGIYDEWYSDYDSHAIDALAELAHSGRALELGSRDPLWRLHAGIAARQAGLAAAADRHLAIADAGRAALTPRAAALLRRVER